MIYFKVRLPLFVSLLFAFTLLNAQNLKQEEIVSERDMFSKTFITQEGAKEVILYGEPIHYSNAGEWDDISTELISHSNQFINESNVFKTYFPSLNNNSTIKLKYNSEQISLGLIKTFVEYTSVNGLLELNIPKNAMSTKVNVNEVTYEGLYSNISDHYIVGKGKLKNNVIIDGVLSDFNKSKAEYVGFQEELELPNNWRIETSQNSSLTEDGLKIFNAKNEHILSIPAPVYYDNKAILSDGSDLNTGLFLVTNNENTWSITTLISTNWINDNKRVYPITIDPTVVLAGADGGWQSQNNYVNNPNFVFIGVCCGNLEHRAWIKFNTTSIPDNSCVTDVELEVFVNGVGNATTELVHAYDITGAFGPYAAINPAVYADMGNGYYTSFNISGTGTYGYYDLGPSADALLQSQLPVNWYQVSLIFDNEPSTNWKRLTAGSCNLRVTYDPPPCSVLPVELTSFDLECVNDGVELSWSTQSEIQNDRFEVLKSEDKTNFYSIGNVKGNGSTSSPQSYTFYDYNLSSKLSYYKLKQVDFNGKETVYNTISSNCKNIEFGLSNLHLSQSNLKFRLNTTSKEKVQINLVSIDGRVLLNESHSSINGNNEINFNVNAVPGIYFLNIISKNESVSYKLIPVLD